MKKKYLHLLKNIQKRKVLMLLVKRLNRDRGLNLIRPEEFHLYHLE